jgi:hypothetical protein
MTDGTVTSCRPSLGGAVATERAALADVISAPGSAGTGLASRMIENFAARSGSERMSAAPRIFSAASAYTSRSSASFRSLSFTHSRTGPRHLAQLQHCIDALWPLTWVATWGDRAH